MLQVFNNACNQLQFLISWLEWSRWTRFAPYLDSVPILLSCPCLSGLAFEVGKTGQVQTHLPSSCFPGACLGEWLPAREKPGLTSSSSRQLRSRQTLLESSWISIPECGHTACGHGLSIQVPCNNTVAKNPVLASAYVYEPRASHNPPRTQFPLLLSGNNKTCSLTSFLKCDNVYEFLTKCLTYI